MWWLQKMKDESILLAACCQGSRRSLQHIWSWQKGSQNYQGSMCKTLQALWRNVSGAVISGVMGFNSPAQPGPTRTQIPHNLSLFSWLNSEITDDAYFYLPKITVTLAMKTSAWEVWGDGSAVKSTCYSSRGPGFGSQNPHKGSQPSITPVPEDRLSSSALLYEANVWCLLHRQQTHT